MTITIWYNPKCGTCRKVRAEIEAKGHRLRLVEYLKAPPSVEEIDAVCRKAGLEPRELARRKEPVYESVAARCKTRQDWLKALHENPILIERPIVILEDRALIARPPERVAELGL